jgi:hypothetical protein
MSNEKQHANNELAQNRKNSVENGGRPGPGLPGPGENPNFPYPSTPPTPTQVTEPPSKSESVTR